MVTFALILHILWNHMNSILWYHKFIFIFIHLYHEIQFDLEIPKIVDYVIWQNRHDFVISQNRICEIDFVSSQNQIIEIKK